MKVLIANPGSTSYKCKLYETSNMSVLFQATVERIGDSEGIYSYSLEDGEQKKEVLEIHDYFKAVDLTLSSLTIVPPPNAITTLSSSDNCFNFFDSISLK